MKIVYWSDFICPNSYIGLNRLKNAVNELDLDFEWEIKSFELEPMIGGEATLSSVERHASKYGITPEDAEAEIREIEEIAYDEGLKINYKDAQIVNTRNAHRLAKFAQKSEPEISQNLIEKIYEGIFKDGKNISDIAVLSEIASSVGFDKNEIEKLLLSDSYDVEVSIDEEDARFNGLYSVPFYIIVIDEEQLSVPGAFGKEDFKIAIQDMINGDIRYKSFI